MQHHVSYKKDAVIENPLHFILLIKLLIMPFFFPLSHFYFFAPNLSTLSTLRRNCKYETLLQNVHKETITKPVAKHFTAL